MNFLMKYKVLTKKSIWISSQSLNSAIFKVLSNIVENVDKNKKIAELPKAFHTVDHTILLKKLK